MSDPTSDRERARLDFIDPLSVGPDGVPTRAAVVHARQDASFGDVASIVAQARRAAEAGGLANASLTATGLRAFAADLEALAELVTVAHGPRWEAEQEVRAARAQQ